MWYAPKESFFIQYISYNTLSFKYFNKAVFFSKLKKKDHAAWKVRMEGFL